MARLTIKDEQGNWALKGVKWNQLHVGETITQQVQEKIYGALAKLKDYEDSGMTPDKVVEQLEERSSLARPVGWSKSYEIITLENAIETVKGGGVDA